MKSEPDTFSIDDLKNRPNSAESWDGVRNYQARNFMRDEMKNGDLVLFYHSSCKVPGIAGIAKVSKESHPDTTSFNKTSKYFDPKSTEQSPRWFMVEITFVEKFKNILELKELKECPELEGMTLLQKGSRLSIQPVQRKHFDFITKKLSRL